MIKIVPVSVDFTFCSETTAGNLESNSGNIVGRF